MKNPVRRRAFYTLMRCIAALALCTAFSLAVLLPAGRARVVTVGGVAAVNLVGVRVSGDVGTYFTGPEGCLFVLLCLGLGR